MSHRWFYFRVVSRVPEDVAGVSLHNCLHIAGCRDAEPVRRTSWPATTSVALHAPSRVPEDVAGASQHNCLHMAGCRDAEPVRRTSWPATTKVALNV